MVKKYFSWREVNSFYLLFFVLFFGYQQNVFAQYVDVAITGNPVNTGNVQVFPASSSAKPEIVNVRATIVSGTGLFTKSGDNITFSHQNSTDVEVVLEFLDNTNTRVTGNFSYIIADIDTPESVFIPCSDRVAFIRAEEDVALSETAGGILADGLVQAGGVNQLDAQFSYLNVDVVNFTMRATASGWVKNVDLNLNNFGLDNSPGSGASLSVIVCSNSDIDNDGETDLNDLDDDNDGILDVDEAGAFNPVGDEDGDTVPNYLDLNDDGNAGDGSNTDYTDANNDGIPDVFDTDNDGVPNHFDTDSDNDGCFDAIEGDETVTASQLDSVGAIDIATQGGIDSDGVPQLVNSNGQGQGGGNEIVATEVALDASALIDVTQQTGNGLNFTITSASATNTTDYTGSLPNYSGPSATDVSGTLVYQWQEDGVNLSNTGVYLGTNTSTLTISDVTGLNGKVYNLIVTHPNNTCVDIQNSATLTVIDPCTNLATAGTVTPNDPDADGINNVCDLDDDNDGILDADECAFIKLKPTDLSSPPGGNATMYSVVNEDISDLFNLPPNSLFVTITNGATNPSGGAWIANAGTGAGTFEFSGPYSDFMFVTAAHGGSLGDGVQDGFESLDLVEFKLDSPLASDFISFNSGSNYYVENPVGGAIVNNGQRLDWQSTEPGAKRIRFSSTSIAGSNSQYFIELRVCDTDRDQVLDHLDLDSDNDGIYDVVESGGTPSTTNLGQADGTVGTSPTTNGIPSSAATGTSPINTISTSPADYINTDSDGDGCSDANEAYADANADGGDGGVYNPSNTATEPLTEVAGTVNSNGIVVAAAYSTPVNIDGASPANDTRFDFQQAGTTLTITSQPTSLITNGVGSVVFQVLPNLNYYAYQWQVDKQSGGGFVNIDSTNTTDIYTGSDTALLTLTGATATENGYVYQVIITDGSYVCSSVTSNSATLTIDTTAPTADTFTSNDITPTLTGSGEPNETLTITVDSDGDGTPEVTYTVTTDASGNWSIDPDTATPDSGTFPTLSDDDTIDVVATDAGGNTGSGVVTIDTTAPTADTFTSNDITPTLTGSGEPNETLTITVDSDGDGTPEVTYTVTTDASGNWSIDPDTATPDSGTFPALSDDDTIDVVATDAGGNTGSGVVTIDTTAPTADTFTSNDITPTLTGSGEPNETLTITVDSDGDGTPEVTYTVTTDASGNWSIDPDTATPDSGTFPTLSDDDTIDVVATDAGGNTGSGVVTIDTTAPTADTFTSNDITPTLTGSGEPNETLTITVDSDGDGTPEVTYTVTTDASGNWSIDPDTATPDSGTFPTLSDDDTIDVVATDAGGNTGSGVVTIDTTAPTADTFTSNDITPTLTGSGEPNETLTITVDSDGDGTPEVTYTVTTDASGNWSIDPDTATPDSGTFPTLSDDDTIDVVATDAGGNTGSGVVTIDTTAPTADTFTSNDITPTLTGSGEPNETLTITVDSDGDGTPEVTYTVTTDASGNWSIDPDTATPDSGTFPTLSDDDTIDVVATDAGGNTGSGVVTIDTTAPTADTFTSNDITPTLTGSGEPNETLTITVDSDGDGTPEVTYTVTTDASGNWSIDPDTATPDSGTFPTLSDDDTIDVVATDAGGNTGSGVVTIDTTAPTADTFTSNDITPTLTGSGEPNETLTITVDSDGDGTPEVTYTVTTDASGNWSIDPDTATPDSGTFPTLSDDDTIDVVATDVGGNTGSGVVAIDTTAPTADTFTSNDITPTLTGSGEPNETLTIMVDADGDGTPEVTYTVTTDASGNWSIDPDTATPDSGTFPTLSDDDTIDVVVMDAVGNTGSGIVTIDTTAPTADTFTSNDITPTLTGSGEPNETLTITVDADGDGTPEVTYIVTTDASGNWSIDPDTATPDSGTFPTLSDDDTIDVVATDAGGNTGSGVVTIDTTAPTADTFTSNDITPTLTGSGEPNETLTITVDADGDGTPEVTYTVTTDASGNWSIDPDTATPDSGTFPTLSDDDTIDVVATDAGGNTGSGVVTIDTTAPTADTFTSNDITPTLTGSGEPNETLTITVDSDGDGTPEVTYTVTTNASGNWSIDPDTATPDSGTFPALSDDDTIDVVATDAGGNTGSGVVTIDTTAPTADTFTSNDITPTLTGSGEPNETLTITVDSDGDGTPEVTYTVTTDASGNWSIDPDTATPDSGTFPTLSDDDTIDVVATDVGGNTGSGVVTIDTTAPTADTFTSNDITPTLTGSGEPNETLTITVDSDGDGTPEVTYTVTTDASGNWSIDPDTATPDSGTFPTLSDDDTIDVVATDVGGNTGSGVVTIDTTAPTADTFTSNDITPTLTGSGEPNETLTITVDSDGDGTPEVTYTVTTDASGNWSIDPDTATPDSGTFPTLSDDDIIDVVATDVGGNTGSGVVTIDTTAPTVDTFTSNDITPTLTGSGEPNETLTITVDSDGDGTPEVTYTVTTDASGNWSIDPDTATPDSGTFPALSDDDTIDVVATDAGGNTGSGVVTIDTTAPTADTFTSNDITPTLTGSGEPNETLTIMVDADGDGTPEVTYTVTTDASGNWSIDPDTATPDSGTFPTLADNDTIDVVATDAGGNTGSGVVTIVLDQDTDEDGVPDNIDVDDDNDGIPDSAEGTGDTDGDGIPDSLDLDSDNDGILDVDEGGNGDLDTNGDGVIDSNDTGYVDSDNDGQADDSVDTEEEPDTDGDGVPDYQDLDSDNDGINDVIENGNGDLDTNNDGVIDSNDTGGSDSDEDGISDSVDSDSSNFGEGNGGEGDTVDTDGDGVPDYQDLDSDDDGINDITEGGNDDEDGNGLVDGPDSDGDGILDEVDEDDSGFGDAGNTDVNDTDPTDPNIGGTGVVPDSGTDSDGDGISDSVDGDDTAFGDFIDTDGDGIPDNIDVDDDNDGIPDSAEGTGDTDGDGIPDSLDLDSDNDGILDVDEGGNGDLDTNGDGVIDSNDTGYVDSDNDGQADDSVDTEEEPDTDGDGVPDYQDLDSDNDGINDVIENGNGDLDTNNDGVIDSNDTGGSDSDEDGISDSVDSDSSNFGEGNGGEGDTVDTDGDGVPDYQDLDSDDDGINDITEGGNDDEDGNGVIDGPDSDGDGISDEVDEDDSGFGDTGNTDVNDTDPTDPNSGGTGVVPDSGTDSDGDGISDSVDGDDTGFGDFTDTDGDGIPDNIDVDDDNDGIPDSAEGTGDTDGDGIPDSLDLDSDNDGILDVDEGGNGDLDTNGDGVIDSNDTGYVDSDNDGQADDSVDTEEEPDTDGDGVPDYQDLDSDNDGINDVIENGNGDLDTNNDGVIDSNDTGGSDSDEDGISDSVDSDSSNFGEGNGGEGDTVDTDGDGVPDYQDLDSDDDGINDITEGGNDDEDGNGIVDGPDSDGDGILDEVDEDDSGFGDAGNTDVNDTDPTDPNSGGTGVLPDSGTDSDGDGISDSADINNAVFGDAVGVDDCVTVYNEFTPNDDGSNDTLIINCIENYPNNTLEIFNRWGNLVYSKKQYKNTWDGTSNGRANIQVEDKLPSGTYFYVLDLGNGNKVKKGWIYINRD